MIVKNRTDKNNCKKTANYRHKVHMDLIRVTKQVGTVSNKYNDMVGVLKIYIHDLNVDTISIPTCFSLFVGVDL